MISQLGAYAKVWTLDMGCMDAGVIKVNRAPIKHREASERSLVGTIDDKIFPCHEKEGRELLIWSIMDAFYYVILTLYVFLS